MSAAAMFALAARASAADFYAAPNGSSSNSGSFGSPWSLAKALSHPSAVHPGDTIWLRGGTYPNNGGSSYWSTLTGTSGAPIIVRAYPGERVTIDGGNTGGAAILVIQGAYTWYWGFEVMSSAGPHTSTQSGPWPSDLVYGEGILIEQTTDHPGLKFINLIIHDTRQGISWWKQAVDSEINGCLIYYNGWLGPDDGHGHGIYSQNQTGAHRAIDNILFYQFGHGFHVYGSPTSFLNNFDLEGNTLFQNGELTTYNQRNLLLGGDSTAQSPTLISNYLYYQPGGPSTALKLGNGAACTNPTVTNNYVANNSWFNCTGITMSGNTFSGSISGIVQSSFPNNIYLPYPPTGVKVFVRPNQYEAGRANITVYNWNLQSSVSVDLSGVLSIGQGYEVRNAQNFFGSPVLTGVFDGSPLQIPLTGLPAAAPVGWSAPLPTGPEFNAFVVRVVVRPNIVFRNRTTGQDALWLMNGTTFHSVADLPMLSNLNYRIEGAGDFNGDGQMDLVLRNYATGQNALWIMNGTTVTAVVDLPALTDTNYHIEAVGDLNGDGKPDILLRNVVTGRNAAWLMNGTTLTGVVDLPALSNTNFWIGGVGDFNADGRKDILWRNLATGQNAVWLMNGTSLLSIVDLPALTDVNYRFGAVADYNADGKPDIALRNYATGRNSIWLMNGTGISSIVDLPGLADTNWEMTGPK